jgi:hypothetical protein
MEKENIELSFSGPYSWVDSSKIPCLFESPLRQKAGIYLWTVPQAKDCLIYYVGETGRTFDVRFFEHFKEHFSGCYHLYDPISLSEGKKVCIWPGKYDKEFKFSIPSLADSFTKLAPTIVSLARLYRFYLAPIDCDMRLRQRLEAAIADHLYKKPGIIGQFQDRGIRYRPRKREEKEIKFEKIKDL